MARRTPENRARGQQGSGDILKLQSVPETQNEHADSGHISARNPLEDHVHVNAQEDPAEEFAPEQSVDAAGTAANDDEVPELKRIGDETSPIGNDANSAPLLVDIDSTAPTSW